MKVVKLTPTSQLPVRATCGSAGYDLFSDSDVVIPAHGKGMVNTGISVSIPENCYGRIAPRSSLAWKSSIDVGAGVIDSDYRGEIKIILFNHSDENFVVKFGDKIAQLIIQQILLPHILEVSSLDETERGTGGFGSTNVN